MRGHVLGSIRGKRVMLQSSSHVEGDVFHQALAIEALLLKAGVTVPQLFLITGLLNLVVAGYIFLIVPEYLLRFCAEQVLTINTAAAGGNAALLAGDAPA